MRSRTANGHRYCRNHFPRRRSARRSLTQGGAIEIPPSIRTPSFRAPSLTTPDVTVALDVLCAPDADIRAARADVPLPCVIAPASAICWPVMDIPLRMPSLCDGQRGPGTYSVAPHIALSTRALLARRLTVYLYRGAATTDSPQYGHRQYSGKRPARVRRRERIGLYLLGGFQRGRLTANCYNGHHSAEADRPRAHNCRDSSLCVYNVPFRQRAIYPSSNCAYPTAQSRFY